jgi:hypothetical protein
MIDPEELEKLYKDNEKYLGMEERYNFIITFRKNKVKVDTYVNKDELEELKENNKEFSEKIKVNYENLNNLTIKEQLKYIIECINLVVDTVDEYYNSECSNENCGSSNGYPEYLSFLTDSAIKRREELFKLLDEIVEKID